MMKKQSKIMSNPICKKCKKQLSIKIMNIIEGKCWKCNAQMKVATLYSPTDQIRGSTHVSPDIFTKEEIKFASSKGVLIKLQHSKTADDTYFANTCGECNAFVGSHYLFTQYIIPAKEKKVESEDFEIGYHCETCFLEEELKAYNEKYGEI